MRVILVTAVILASFTVAVTAQEPNGYVGIFFQKEELSCATAQIEVAVDEPFLGFIVIVETDLSSIGGYELSLSLLPQVLGVSWPNGGIN